jgi:hypothetical protein
LFVARSSVLARIGRAFMDFNLAQDARVTTDTAKRTKEV